MPSLGRASLWVSLLVFSGCASPEHPGRDTLIELAPCQLRASDATSGLAARCGLFHVPEDRSRENGRRLALRVAVVPAVSRSPEPDPLVFLSGGPGQAATDSFAAVSGAFHWIRQERDIVLVDQRGTGGSHPLRCPEPEEARELWLLSDDALERWAKRCLDELDADLRFYTTSIAMRDLDEVLDALGYREVNLYGVSYGSRAALTYAGMFPARVRAMILDGVVPQQEALGLDVPRDAARALERLIERCRREPPCRRAFPDLEASLDALMARLAEPVSVTLGHPRTGEEHTLLLDRSMAAHAIRLLSYSEETVALVPLVLHSASKGDLVPLAAQFLMTTGQIEETVADAMGISVVCSEDFPFYTEDDVEEYEDDGYLSAVRSEHLRTLCPLWPRGEVPANFKEPVRSKVPALLLSGEADPVTPPENGALVDAELENGLHLVVPGQGHVVIHRGCVPRLVAGFLASARPEELDPACVESVRPSPFFVGFTGPLP